MDAYEFSIAEILEELKTSEKGLTEEQVQNIQITKGNNILPKKKSQFLSEIHQTVL